MLALQAPKFLPWRAEVCASIAHILGVPSDRIFVKAKTGEGLGPVGASEAVEAWATCLLTRDEEE